VLKPLQPLIFAKKEKEIGGQKDKQEIKNAKCEICSPKETSLICVLDSAFEQNVPSINDYALRLLRKRLVNLARHASLPGHKPLALTRPDQ
jgi:hypothetical protein